MNLAEWFDKGLTLQQYEAGMNVNQEEMKSIYERFQLSDHQKEELKAVKAEGTKIIVLTEDWCGDAMLNIPILLKIAEHVKMEVRFLLRDQNPELMDQYLTNGTSRAIPIFIFIDLEGNERAVWGPRAAKLQEFVSSERAQLPDSEAPEFKEKQKEMYGRITKAYKENEQLWFEVAESIMAKLKGM